MHKDTPRSRQAEQVKATILEAAIPLFARGYDSVAVQDIAAAAGHKHSLVMYHFGSKERLWEQTAERLMQRFDAAHRGHLGRLRKDASDRQKLRQLLLAFVLALRELPAYGQILLSEGVQASGRLLWLHRHFFPSAFLEMQFEDARLRELLMKVTLPRSAMVGALLYTVVAAPQIAISAQQDGSGIADGIHPLGDAMAERLVGMMCDFVLSQLDGKPRRRR
ncbi:TetR/AcrR family transcriptional regulator [Solimonas sp. K1W22B-7]|uniref:TetR/AcrR family transcriptional regulator n=1 Tax=Solimonas sp. K1W22B-7 TaxID=2303331 RepID=UPI0013C45F17|nr:TetR family transcriptional regulator [Solimonas sp. K1W22B-7]